MKYEKKENNLLINRILFCFTLPGVEFYTLFNGRNLDGWCLSLHKFGD